MAQFGIGQAARRVEDQRFITGRGKYVDDVNLPHQHHAFMLRSPHAHARVVSIDASAAAAAPGVVLVATGADLVADGIGTIPSEKGITNRDGSDFVRPPHPALSIDRVRHVGDTVAMVVAATATQARDAAELILVEYETLPAVTEAEAAAAAEAPLVWDEVPGNLCIDWELGTAAAVDAGFAKAAHIVRLRLVNNRIVVNSIEPRGALADYDAAADRTTLYTSSQGSHYLRNMLADTVFKVPRDSLRVVTPDVGGGFGMKAFLFPEQVLVLWAARKLQIPVKWIGERSDAFLTDTQGRDHVTTAELALDAEGSFLALRVSTVANLGAYLSQFGAFIPTVAGSGMLAGLYKIPAVHVSVRCYFTNTTPIDAYRGAGRPEAAYVVERLVEVAARRLGVTGAELRRRNFIPPEALPYTTALGETYDSGDFAGHMEEAMRRADWNGAPRRKEQARRSGKLRGIGMSTYVEACGGGGEDMAEVRLDPDASVTLLIGTQSSGQGHHTAYGQIVADRLGIPLERIRFVQGDTDRIPFGSGTGGSRSLPVGGNALIGAIDKVIDKGKRIAAVLMEAAPADIEFADGAFTVAGTDKSVGLKEVAKAAYDAKQLKDEVDFGLTERSAYLPKTTYPNGCHIAEVEIDRETGELSLVAYTVVDDFGMVINPMLLAGQVHGGAAQGIGQALHEHCIYDPDSGQLLSGSFMDYRLPRAGDLPMFAFHTRNVPCTTNPLGIKGAGEAGSIGAPPAVINAVVDALAEFGVTHIDMPTTPQRIWSVIHGGPETGVRSTELGRSLGDAAAQL